MKKQKNHSNNKYNTSQNTMEVSTASETDCTGILPTPPLNDAELESYMDIYPYLPHSGISESTLKSTAKETLPDEDFSDETT